MSVELRRRVKSAEVTDGQVKQMNSMHRAALLRHAKAVFTTTIRLRFDRATTI